MSEKREPTHDQEEHEPIDHHDERAEDVEQHSGNDEEPQETKTTKMAAKMDSLDKTHPTMALAIFVVIQFICILFMTIATPIGMFKIDDEWRDQIYPSYGGKDRLCVTAWGMKMGCGTKDYYHRSFTHAFCYRVRINFKVVEALSIMTISFMTITFIMGIFSLFQMVGKMLTAAMGVFCMILCLIPWCVLAGMYHQLPCCNTIKGVRDCSFYPEHENLFLRGKYVPRFKTMGSYGPAFGLIVTAWTLQLIASVIAFLPF